MTGGADNSVKQWIFDNTDGSARLLKYRAGHAAPPTEVAFYGEGRRLLSAGTDRVSSSDPSVRGRRAAQEAVEGSAVAGKDVSAAVDGECAQETGRG